MVSRENRIFLTFAVLTIALLYVGETVMDFSLWIDLVVIIVVGGVLPRLVRDFAIE